MKHAREDYNRIQDPALHDPSLLTNGSTPIQADEPVFLLRAQDLVAPDAVEAWADEAEKAGVETHMVLAARFHAKRMRKWQAAHGFKRPDMPRQ